MPKIELEQITSAYEFEDRAAFFIKEVEKVAARYTSARIEVENITLERICELQGRIKELRTKNKDPRLLKQLTVMEHDFQAESAAKNGVIVSMYTHTSRPITPFELKVDAIAKTYRGIRRENENDVIDFGDDESEEAYRFVAIFIYDFNNDIKKVWQKQK